MRKRKTKRLVSIKGYLKNLLLNNELIQNDEKTRDRRVSNHNDRYRAHIEIPLCLLLTLKT